MKKINFLMALALLATVTLHAQKDNDRTQVIKVNPLGAIFGSANLAYEKALGEGATSILLAPSFGFFKSGTFKYTTYGLGAEYRFYFKKEAPEGTYFAPGVGYTFGQAKYEDAFGSGADEKTNVGGFAAKGVFGKQWIWGGGFTLDLNGGIQYINLKFADSQGIFANSAAFSGILPALGVSIGYAF
jgi:hypothetical protein